MVQGKPQIVDTKSHEFESTVPISDYHQNFEQETPKMADNVIQPEMPRIHQEGGFQSFLAKTMGKGPISELESGNVDPKIQQTNLMNNFNGQFQPDVQSQNGQEITGSQGNGPFYGFGSYEQNNPKVLPEMIQPYPTNTLYNSQFEQNLQTSAYSEFQTNKPNG